MLLFDSVFSSRNARVCNIRLNAVRPCVGLVSQADYAKQMSQARRFLNGNSADIQREYAQRMHAAADILDFETAAIWRNRIRALTGIQANQDINIPNVPDADIIAIARSGERIAFKSFSFVAGRS